ncbi:50S ribosomal protein L30 [Chloroflexota bacterium]
MSKLRITWVRSGIGHTLVQKRTLKSLGLHRLNQTVTHNESASIRGMVGKVKHLVNLEVESGDAE